MCSPRGWFLGTCRASELDLKKAVHHTCNIRNGEMAARKAISLRGSFSSSVFSQINEPGYYFIAEECPQKDQKG